MTMKAKILVKDKFWIIEENGQKLGTLQKKDDNGWIFLGSPISFMLLLQLMLLVSR